MHEDEPNVVLDRRTADLMSDVDKARARSLRSVKKAKRSIKEAKATVAEMDKMSLDPRKVPFHVIPHPIKRKIIRYKMRFKKMEIGGHGGSVGDGRTLIAGFTGKLRNRLSSPKRSTGYESAAPAADDTSDEEEDLPELKLPVTPITKALGRGRKRPTSANRHGVRPPRPRSAGPKLINHKNKMGSSQQVRKARPQSAGPTSGRRRINFESSQ